MAQELVQMLSISMGVALLGVDGVGGARDAIPGRLGVTGDGAPCWAVDVDAWGVAMDEFGVENPGLEGFILLGVCI